MDFLKKILNGILLALFIEAILFAPLIFLITIGGMLITGDVFGIVLKTWKYTVPFLVALTPYIIIKKTKPDIAPSKLNYAVMTLGLLASICFLIYCTGLFLRSCAGHPPY